MDGWKKIYSIVVVIIYIALIIAYIHCEKYLKYDCSFGNYCVRFCSSKRYYISDEEIKRKYLKSELYNYTKYIM